MTMKLYHGTRNGKALALHIGLCLTDDRKAAGHHGDTVTVVELDASDLVLSVVDAYDHETNTAAGDSDPDAYEADGIDMISYLDETERSRQHQTYRIVSRKAMAACRILGEEG